MDYIVPFLLAGIFAVLVAILIQLVKLRAESKWKHETNWRQPEPAEGRQTVTVNVGAVPDQGRLPATVSESAPLEKSAAVPAVNEAPPEPEPERPAPAVSRIQSSLRPGSGAPGAIKCPHCGAENSSFRTECFRCSKTL